MKYIIIVCFTFLLGGVNAQISGVVIGSDKNIEEPIPGAKVYLLHAKRGEITDEDGKFEFILPKDLPDTIVFSAIGYYPDTLIVTKDDRFASLKIKLYSDQLLPDVVVSAKRNDHSISRLKTLYVEEISSGELRKAACCNLSESFETNASVDVNITDAVSGAKKIQMMGLDGVYTQLQLENIPYLRGLESSFGLNSIPGTWIQSIQITKGTGNVVNGYESMAGLINFEIQKPHDMDAFYLNFYGNSLGRAEINVHSGIHLSKKWTTGIFVHASTTPVEIDQNNDGFKDITNGTNFALMNRYHYQGEKMEAQIGINAYQEDKTGGQIEQYRNVDSFYNVGIKSDHIDLFAKTGFFMKKPYNSIGVVYNLKYQTFDGEFGTRKFNGEEKRGYVNAMFEGIFGSTIHKYKTGISGVYSDITQTMDSLDNSRLEIVPGAFFEYTYTGLRLSAVAGIRGDYHNLYGFQYAPRLHLKYAFTEYTDLRATVGKGWRVPNYMIDNISLLATSRQWVAPTETKPEISWNMGASLVQRFKFLKRNSSITFDFYHTNFENQLIVDRDVNINQIVFKNFDGGSYSNSFQTELSLDLSKTLDLRIAYKYLDVKAQFGGEMQQRVMVPKHRGFVNLGYKTRSKRWEFDITGSIFGQSRLPVNMLPDGKLTTENTSQVYPMVNAQVTHVYKRWEFYVGGENLTNYTQKNPIIDAANPFSNTFDATRTWAPIIGARVYGGLRFTIEAKQDED